jgi:hypothetical protein
MEQAMGRAGQIRESNEGLIQTIKSWEFAFRRMAPKNVWLPLRHLEIRRAARVPSRADPTLARRMDDFLLFFEFHRISGTPDALRDGNP